MVKRRPQEAMVRRCHWAMVKQHQWEAMVKRHQEEAKVRWCHCAVVKQHQWEAMVKRHQEEAKVRWCYWEAMYCRVFRSLRLLVIVRKCHHNRMACRRWYGQRQRFTVSEHRSAVATGMAVFS